MLPMRIETRLAPTQVFVFFVFPYDGERLVDVCVTCHVMYCQWLSYKYWVLSKQEE